MNSIALLGRARSVVVGAVAALLIVSAGAQPANDMFANRIALSGTNVVTSGSNVGATSETGEPEHAGEPGGASVWWTWTAPRSGAVAISTAGSTFDTLLAVYIGSTVSSLTEVASNDEDPSSYFTSKVTFAVDAGQRYEIAVDGYYGDSGSIVLQLKYLNPPANDLFANRINLTGTNVATTGSNVDATREAGEPYHAGLSGGGSVWWSWTASFSGTATVSTTGSDFDTLLGIYTGSSVSNLATIASDDESGGNSTSKVSFDTIGGQVYAIAVDGYDGATGTVYLTVQLAPSPPLTPAAAWTLQDPYGQTMNSSDLASKVVLLNFWATWCGPCKAELPDIVALQEAYGADGLEVIGADVSWSWDSAATIQSFLSSWSPTINYPVVLSTSAVENTYGGISAVPTTFIIDRQNLIRKKFVGTQTRATFERQIIPLLYGNTRLESRRSGNQTWLLWPTNAAGFTLETATSLASPVWTNWPTAPSETNGSNTVAIPMSGPARFFRLRLPY